MALPPSFAASARNGGWSGNPICVPGMACAGGAERALGVSRPRLPRALPEDLAAGPADAAAVARGLAPVRLGLGLRIVPPGLGARQVDAPTRRGMSIAIVPPVPFRPPCLTSKLLDDYAVRFVNWQ